MAKKRQKRAATTRSSKPPKTAPKRSAKATRGTRPGPAARRAVATALPVAKPVGPTLLEQAEHLRDEIQRSKLTHPDPWTYGAKARAWSVRAQALVEQVAVRGDDPAARRALAALEAEVQGSHDFQEARRLF